MMRVWALWAAAGALVALPLGPSAPAAQVQSPSSAISYETLFQDPGASPVEDRSLENHAINLIAATPAGAQITFAFRDFNRRPVADALIAAHRRGVQVDGVIDGGERTRAVVRTLQSAIGATRVVLCGSPEFTFHSCIADSEVPSLMHNKFLTFSRLDDGREHVVLETSKNFLGPNQLFAYNDMVEISGDVALHEAYLKYLFDLKAQVRTDDYDLVGVGDEARNTFFASPRRQSDPDTNDTIVDRMNEIDCSEGGSASGTGLIRVANFHFRTERRAILRKLVDLKRARCDIEVITTQVDGDIIAGLVSAGIPVHPFVLQATEDRPDVIMHSKFWLVDAKSTLTGRRTRTTYAGSSNWRADQQRSDDLLLRIIDDGVYSDYSAYWKLIRSRAKSDPPQPETDVTPPGSALSHSPDADGAGWNDSDVTLRIAASDGQLRTGTGGLARLRVELTGAQTGSWDFPGETDERSAPVDAYNVKELVISAEGRTTVTYRAEDRFGNWEEKSHVVYVDKTAPTLSGLPEDCELWPPNNKLVRVADVRAADPLSGISDGPQVSASSNALSDEQDIVIDGGSVYLRAEKAERGGTRLYTIRASATDVAGNTATATGTCRVPHSRGDGGR